MSDTERRVIQVGLVTSGVIAVASLALIINGSSGEIIAGVAGLVVTVAAIGLAIREFGAAIERGRLERLWALEARWHGTEGVEARIDARLLQEELASVPWPFRLATFQGLRTKQKEHRRQRAHVILVLNLLEDFCEAAFKGYVDAERVRKVYGADVVDFRAEWAFWVKDLQLRAVDRIGEAERRDDDLPFFYLDKMAGLLDEPASTWSRPGRDIHRVWRPPGR